MEIKLVIDIVSGKPAKGQESSWLYKHTHSLSTFKAAFVKIHPISLFAVYLCVAPLKR